MFCAEHYLQMDSVVIAMNRYFKITEDGIIKSVGIGKGNTEISKEEYDKIIEYSANRPKEDGYFYELMDNFNYLKIPIEIEENYEISLEEAMEELLKIL